MKSYKSSLVSGYDGEVSSLKDIKTSMPIPWDHTLDKPEERPEK